MTPTATARASSPSSTARSSGGQPLANRSTGIGNTIRSGLRSSGISDERVLDAVADVPRDEFVPTQLRPRAYENVALPIGQEQTISQPAVVAHMCQAVHPERCDHVLEVGTGSGYGAA